jgi:predicted TIM-barrel fold metal-dependent hydrolase
MAQYLTPPPDPNPRKPRFAVPHGAWDCQIHLFGPRDRYPFDPDSPYVSDPALPETAIAVQGTLGLARQVVVSGGGYGLDYQHLVDTLRQFPDRFVGVIFPSARTTDEEFERLHGLGVRGVRFVSRGRAKNLPQIDAGVAARIKPLDWPIHFYPTGTDLLEYADELLALPCDKLVLDHFASVPAAMGVDQPAFKCLLRMLDTGRVWVKLSGPMRCTKEEPPYPSVTPLARALVAHAPERMVWGSDWPHVNMVGRTMPNDGDLIDLVRDWVPDDRVREQIFVANPRTLYGAEGLPS